MTLFIDPLLDCRATSCLLEGERHTHITENTLGGTINQLDVHMITNGGMAWQHF